MVRSVSMGLAILLLAGCGHQEGKDTAIVLPEADVWTHLVGERTHTRMQWLPGTVYPVEQALVAAKIMATVEEVSFTIGQAVTAGDILIELRADEIDARVEQAEAALAQLERNYERDKGLLAQSATTAEAVRTLEDRIRLAKAELAEAKTMEGYQLIRAPFNGTVTSKKVRRGDLATPGMVLFSIEGSGALEIQVQVPDSLSALPYGTVVAIEADRQKLESRLAEWSPAADPASRTRLVKLVLPAESPVRSGQYVRVGWPAGETTSIWIPAEALSIHGQMERVYLVEESFLRLRMIKTGIREAGWIQVLAGLKSGDQVVLSPGNQLKDGQPAKVIQ
ncbi:MAG: efflux RND transporter periplasmic adaptor subunit [Puniceicoccaceae bacterium]